MMEVRAERTGWRDEDLSARHKAWGWNCPAVDLDFVMCEYNHGVPVALIEYKHKNANLQNMSSPTRNALADLATNYNKGPLPCFIAVYCPVDWWFKIIPLNPAAEKVYPNEAAKNLSERRFVASLYYMRKMKLSKEDDLWMEKLNSITPMEPKA